MGHRRRHCVHLAAGRAQHRRRQGGGEPERPARGRRLRDPAAARRPRLLPDLQPARAGAQHPPGRRPELERVPARDPDRDDRLHGDRDRLEPRRGGPRPGAIDPEGDLVGRDRRLRHLLHAAVDRALGDARREARRPLRDAARPAAARRVQERPGARPGREPRPARRGARDREDLRRDPRRDDPVHRDQRGRDRRLADHVLDGELPAAARGVPAAAPEAEDAAPRARGVQRRRHDDLPALRARSTSSAGCTRSARCSRSPSRTPR